MCRHSQAPPNFKFQDSHLETPSPRQSPWSTTPPASGPATCQIHTQSHASPAVAGLNLTLISSFTTQPLNVQICESLHVQGTTTQLRSPTCGTAKPRPGHGTKPDFAIRLIPPYADDHSSCLAQAPSWTSRLAAYGPGPSAWSPGSHAHPPATHSAPAVADDRRLQPTGAVRRGS